MQKPAHSRWQEAAPFCNRSLKYWRLFFGLFVRDGREFTGLCPAWYISVLQQPTVIGTSAQYAPGGR